MTGYKLGRYEILKHLASGGMAEVLLAVAGGIEGFERHVVIKRIRGDNARDERFVKMFLDEARLAAALHHQNVVQVHDIGSEDGEYFFAMEYVHGEDLRQLLIKVSARHERVPLEHVISIISGAAAGLHHAHEQCGPDRRPLGIVHRDVSPANILVGYDGSVKVADFGIAKAALRDMETRSGTLKGKTAYMSPEQCTGGKIDRRSDVFALGIVLYELATVRRLFKGDNDFMTMSTIVHGQIPTPSTRWPEIPLRLEVIIMKALARKPEDRYQTADEFRVALDKFAAESNARGSTSSLSDYMRTQFDDRPLPWLNETYAPIETTKDFDGSESGIVQMTEEARLLTIEAAPNAPIVSARTKAITNSPSGVEIAPIRTIPRPPTTAAIPRVPPANDSGWGASGNAPTTASGTPLAWSPESNPDDELPPVPRPSYGKWILGAAGVVGVLVAVLLIASSGSKSGTAASQPTTTTQPIATSPDPVKADPPKADPPKADPVPTVPPEPVKVETTPETTTTTASNPDLPTKTPPKTGAPKGPPPKKGPKKKFDPNSLFIE